MDRRLSSFPLFPYILLDNFHTHDRMKANIDVKVRENRSDCPDKKVREKIDKEDAKRRKRMQTFTEQLEGIIEEFRYVCLNAMLDAP